MLEVRQKVRRLQQSIERKQQRSRGALQKDRKRIIEGIPWFRASSKAEAFEKLKAIIDQNISATEERRVILKQLGNPFTITTPSFRYMLAKVNATVPQRYRLYQLLRQIPKTICRKIRVRQLRLESMQKTRDDDMLLQQQEELDELIRRKQASIMQLKAEASLAAENRKKLHLKRPAAVDKKSLPKLQVATLQKLIPEFGAVDLASSPLPPVSDHANYAPHLPPKILATVAVESVFSAIGHIDGVGSSTFCAADQTVPVFKEKTEQTRASTTGDNISQLLIANAKSFQGPIAVPKPAAKKAIIESAEFDNAFWKVDKPDKNKLSKQNYEAARSTYDSAIAAVSKQRSPKPLQIDDVAAHGSKRSKKQSQIGDVAALGLAKEAAMSKADIIAYEEYKTKKIQRLKEKLKACNNHDEGREHVRCALADAENKFKRKDLLELLAIFKLSIFESFAAETTGIIARQKIVDNRGMNS